MFGSMFNEILAHKFKKIVLTLLVTCLLHGGLFEMMSFVDLFCLDIVYIFIISNFHVITVKQR